MKRIIPYIAFLCLTGFTTTSGLPVIACLLYTSDAADDLTRVDLGGRRIIKKNDVVVMLLFVKYNFVSSVYNR